MLSVISPAKSLDFETPAHTPSYSQPRFLDEAAQLITQLKRLSPQEVSQLMKISDQLGSLNAARFQSWSLPFQPDNAKQAVLAFTGDVYQGLDAAHLDAETLEYAQEHLAILSGLYGLLRPLDLIQPYRLEMGTRFAHDAGSDLYQLWKPRLARVLQEQLSQHTAPVLINLASQEYFKSVDVKQLKARIITPVFKDWKNGEYKIISFYAKKARGLMCRYQLLNRIDQPEGLKDFDLEGYQYQPQQSEGDSWVFTRRTEGEG